ncbi:hypothetical protein R3P38DRAFT_2806580 [Favolaschia claudopus]|uniref:Uncharacterized protein n=1 Tax=Favolaschia claudopus TaxID=2862362 RepID=A0AAV9ZJK8_9AGAR
MDHDDNLIEPAAPIIDYKEYLAGPKTNLLPVQGWTSDSILFNHLDENVNKVKAKPITSMAAVIITRDRPADRACGADALADAILNVGLSSKDDFTEGDPNGPVLPHTNLIICDSPEIKDNIASDPTKAIVNTKRSGGDDGFSFYVLPAFPEHSWYIGTYIGVSERVTPHEFLSALFDKLIGTSRTGPPTLRLYPSSCGLSLTTPKSNPAVCSCLADVAPMPNSRRGFASTCPPPSTDNKAIKAWKDHLTSPSFTFLIDNRGRAAPFKPQISDRFRGMECTECLGLDHYKDECPIVNSPAFRDAHPTQTTVDHTVLGTTLGSIRDTDADGFTTVVYRKGRPRFPRTYKRRGWGNRPRRL